MCPLEVPAQPVSRTGMRSDLVACYPPEVDETTRCCCCWGMGTRRLKRDMPGASGMLEAGMLVLLLVTMSSNSGTDVWLTSIWGSSAGAKEISCAHCEAGAGRLEELVLG